MREVAAEFERPVLLFSGGKDSIVLLRLAEKAFRPARFPFPLMHVDTGHNFPEVDRVPRPPRRASSASG
jgi:sulfate adenylyltransferase subunit 2